jgi:hypothetical protein
MPPGSLDERDGEDGAEHRNPSEPASGSGIYELSRSSPLRYGNEGDPARRLLLLEVGRPGAVLQYRSSLSTTGIEAGKDYYIRVIFYNTKRYVYLFDTYARAMGLGASRWEGLQDITSEGSGASSMAAQDPQWLLLAYRSSINFQAASRCPGNPEASGGGCTSASGIG